MQSQLPQSLSAPPAPQGSFKTVVVPLTGHKQGEIYNSLCLLKAFCLLLPFPRAIKGIFRRKMSWSVKIFLQNNRYAFYISYAKFVSFVPFLGSE